MMAFVACMSAKAYYYTVSGNELIVYGNDYTRPQNDASHIYIDGLPNNRPDGTYTTIKFVGDFSDGWTGYWFIGGSGESKENINTIDLSEADFTKDSWSYPSPSEENHADYQYATWRFYHYYDLETVIWPNNPENLAVIPAQAFQENGIETIHIPGYIKLIKKNAFCGVSGTDALSNIVFDEFYLTDEQGNYVTDENGKKISAVDMYIEEEAFTETARLVGVHITTRGNIHAENKAFPLDVTCGHGNPAASLATLTFPKEKASEYANLSHELKPEVAADDNAFHNWLMVHFSQAEGAHNGFYEFVSNGVANEDDPFPHDKFLKTFSDSQYSYLVPNGVKAYIVTDIIEEEVGNNSGKYQYKLVLEDINVIPKNTGVILYGEPNSINSTGGRTLSMSLVNYTGGAYDENSTIRNFLVGTANANGEAVHVKPFDELNGTVTYRNFFFGPFSNSSLGKKYAKEHEGKYSDGNSGGTAANGERTNGDFVGFWRAIESDIAAGKAYLKAPASLYKNGKGGEAIVVPQIEIDVNKGGVEAYRVEYSLVTNPKGYLNETGLRQYGFWQYAVWKKDWGVRYFEDSNNNPINPVFADSFGEAEFEVDGIETISEENNGENVYYNLQGVRVSQPTKGVYISNGKKYIFK